MIFQLKRLILWPRYTDEAPRMLVFEPGSVNVITGASKTGKSAIIPIIDYCLGSERCSIPVKTIRDSCEWFGILVQTESGQRLLARREPGDQKSTTDMYVLEGPSIEVPHRIHKNTTADAVKRSLDELAGLTQLDFVPESLESGSWGRPSLRDMTSFLFQPQNLIANPDVLFFRTDTSKRREKLKEIFPYILNAVTAELLAKLHEHRMLRRELLLKERELLGVQRVSERWIAGIDSKVSMAREVGLISQDVVVPGDLQGKVDLLRRAAAETDVEGRITPEGISEAAEELASLQNEEADLSRRLAQLRRRYAEMTALREVAARYQDAVSIKRDRLRISEWFGRLHAESSECPLCGNALERPEGQVEIFIEALRDSEAQAGNSRSVPAAFDREYQRIREDIAETTEGLNAVTIRRNALARESTRMEEEHYRAREVWRFVGELGESVERFESIQDDGPLGEEVESLRSKIMILESELRRDQIERRTRDALQKVSNYVGQLLPLLDNERPEDPVNLSIRDLTITVSGNGRNDTLWEIGSGANWLSYHVAVMLGLHRLFLSFSTSPVPGFLVFDQPSQVYFPRKAGADLPEGFDPVLEDEDVAAVRAVFEVLAGVVSRSEGRLQVIVLDHADEGVWGGIPGVQLVEEWRRGQKLVPREWIAQS